MGAPPCGSAAGDPRRFVLRFTLRGIGAAAAHAARDAATSV